MQLVADIDFGITLSRFGICRDVVRSVVWLLLFIAVYLLILLPLACAEPGVSLSIPVSELKERIICSEDYLKTLEITVEQVGSASNDGKSEKTYLVQLPELVSSPVINSQLICDVFLQRWIANLREESKTPGHDSITLELQSPPSGSMVRTTEGEYLMHFTSSEPLSGCRKLGLCLTSMLDLPWINDQLVSCTPHLGLSRLINSVAPRVMVANYRLIPHVDVKVFPLKPFAELIAEHGLASNPPVLFTSTMTIGYGSFRRLQKSLGSLTMPTFMLFDAGLSLIAGQEGVATDQGIDAKTESSIFPVPITTGATFDNIHHWKALVGANGIESAITGMNISTPANTLYLDLIYSFKEPAVARELQRYLEDAIAQQCESQEQFRCLSKFVLGETPRQQRLTKQLADSCARFANYRANLIQSQSLVPAPQSSRRYFLQPQTDDLEQLVVELIDNAQSDIVLLSHKLTLTRVIEALNRAKVRGVNVFVMTAMRPRLGKVAIPNFVFFPERLPKDLWLPPPHVKALVIDGQKLFFGSGNFTNNGFKESRELFAMTEDPTAAAAVISIANEYRRFFQPQLTSGTPGIEASGPPRRLVVMQDSEIEPSLRSKATANHSPLVMNYSEPAKEPWLVHYRNILPQADEFLRRCALEHASFIPLKEFEDCLDKEVPLTERFHSQRYPVGENFMQVAAKFVVPFFEKLKESEIHFPNRLPLGFHSRRAESVRLMFERRHGIKPMDLKALGKLLQPLRGARFDLRSPLVRNGVKLADGSQRFANDPSSESAAILSTMLQYAVFAAGKGFLLTLPEDDEGILLLPISNHNLRAYSVHADGTLDDQPYSTFCHGLDSITNPNYFAYWLSAGLLGFQPGWGDGLNNLERYTIIDGISIAIAEQFKFLTLAKKGADHFSGASGFRLGLLVAILNHHEIHNPQLKTLLPKEAHGKACTYFQASYIKRRALRIKIEELLTQDIQLRNPELAQRMLVRSSTTLNLFEELTDALEHGVAVTPDILQAWKEGIEFMRGVS